MTASTRSDTQAILERLGELLRGLTRISGGVDDLPLLTPRQRIALVEIGEAGEPLRLNELAARMGTSAPTASRAVDVLVEHGLVARIADSDDRRALQIELTPSGSELAADRKARAVDALQPAVSALTQAERDELARLLARLVDTMR